jgi:hypothetical protein
VYLEEGGGGPYRGQWTRTLGDGVLGMIGPQDPFR